MIMFIYYFITILMIGLLSYLAAYCESEKIKLVIFIVIAVYSVSSGVSLALLSRILH